VNPIIFFFIPPVVGAFIGYSTNVVAIRMLFRPLREIRIFGIRLPFTPGILPRNRGKLAQSIGAMVERELLTPEIIRQRLGREDVQEKIKKMLSVFTKTILEKPPKELFAGHEEILTEKVTQAMERLYPSLASVLLNFLRRSDIRRELESKGRIFLRNVFFKLNVLQRLFISAAQYDITLEEKMPEIIDELIENTQDLLNDPKTRKTLSLAVSSLLAQDKNISALISLGEDDKRKLDDFLFSKLMTAADGQIESILESINVKSLVSDRIDSLDMLRVERIILDVMSDQFKWIEIFGGILGFLIGLFQSGLSLLLR
jgi:uncharacterized membrane protein YheB (UPF0754 family)